MFTNRSNGLVFETEKKKLFRVRINDSPLCYIHVNKIYIFYYKETNFNKDSQKI